MKTMNKFIITQEYRRFAEFCKACRKEKYIGLCYGPAGVGKTMSANHYAGWDSAFKQIGLAKSHHKGWRSARPTISMAKFHAVVYTPELINSAKTVKEDILELIHIFNHLKERSIYGEIIPGDDKVRLKSYVELLIIDESERFQARSLEQVREIYDYLYSVFGGLQRMGIVFIGMPGIEKRLIRFPQLYSRIGFAHIFKPLQHEEIESIIQNECKVTVNASDIMDQEAVAAMTRITNGNFRLINRLLRQSIRVMQVNKLPFISKEVVEAARECLVIGNIY